MKIKDFISTLGIMIFLIAGGVQASNSKPRETLIKRYTEIVNKVSGNPNPEVLKKLNTLYIDDAGINLNQAYAKGLNQVASQLWGLMASLKMNETYIIEIAKAQKQNGGNHFQYNPSNSDSFLFKYKASVALSDKPIDITLYSLMYTALDLLDKRVPPTQTLDQDSPIHRTWVGISEKIDQARRKLGIIASNAPNPAAPSSSPTKVDKSISIFKEFQAAALIKDEDTLKNLCKKLQPSS